LSFDAGSGVDMVATVDALFDALTTPKKDGTHDAAS
jgi:hypothetical protein